MYVACFKGHDKIAQVLQDHGVRLDDVPDNVSNILFKLYDTTKVNELLWSHVQLNVLT